MIYDRGKYYLCGHLYAGIGPGQSLNCSYITHSESRSMITSILGPDFIESMLVALLKKKKYLRETRANLQHIHG